MRFSFAIFFLTSDAVSSDIKCWTNREGIKECGNKIPPEYSQGASTEISKGGIVLREAQAAKSIEMIKKERIALSRAEEMRNADQVLLNTFASVSDLILARNSKTNQIDKEIRLLESRITKLDENYLKVKSRVSDDTGRENLSNNDQLKKSAELILSQIKEGQNFILTKQNEKKQISKQFETDILRFEELTDSEKFLDP